MPAEAIERLEPALGEAAGAPVELERPGDPTHGDYATNVALRLAGARKQAPRAIAEELAELAAGAARRRAAPRSPAPASSTCGSTRAWYRRGAGRDPRGGPGLRRRLGGAARARPGRDGLGEPDRPDHRRRARGTAPTATRVARLLEFAGHEVEREYYYNDAGAQMDRFRASVEARRRGEEPPEDGYQGAYIEELAAVRRRPGAADARADRGDARALPDPLRLAGRSRASSSSGSPSSCRGSTRTRRTARSGRARRPTATRRTAC